MVLFVAPAVAHKLELELDPARHHVIHANMTMLRAGFPYWNRVQAIRTSPLWMAQAAATGWMSTEGQAVFDWYAPYIMSKPLYLQQAAHLNPWGARYHMWIDPHNLCVSTFTGRRVCPLVCGKPTVTWYGSAACATATPPGTAHLQARSGPLRRHSTGGTWPPACS